jgi:hypothetical protein
MSIISRLKERLLKAAARHTDWSAFLWKHRNRRSIEKYWELGTHPSNSYLLDRLAAEPFGSALELGSGCGPRLYAVSQRWPQATLLGLDINRYAVWFGNERFRELGLYPRVRLETGRIESLDRMESGSFDVCFTWAGLIYVRPLDILKALSEIIRIAGKRIVLLEMHHEDSHRDRLGTGLLAGKGNWIRNYRKLLKGFEARGCSVAFEPLPREIWSPSGGGATCITIHKA